MIRNNKIFVILIVLLAFCETKKSLIFVQQLFRHGARYPIYPRAQDGSNYAVQQNSVGQLTTQGKNMHYLLGKKLHSQYWLKIFGGTQFYNRYNQTKFLIKSTDVNRTIESCQSHLMGIFDSLDALKITKDQEKFSKPFWPGIDAIEGSVFPTALGFHPLPIHVEKTGTNKLNAGDFLRAYAPENCPKQSQWSINNQQGSFAKMVNNNQNITKAIKAFSKVINKTITFPQIGKYFDNFETTLYLGRPTLQIFSDPEYKRTFEYIYTLDLYINLFFTNEQIRATSSRFFEQTLKNIDQAINQRDVQWVIYSAHDTTVGNMLAGMNLTNAACIYQAYLEGQDINKDTCISAYPIYTASIIFQVYDDNQTNTQTFKIRYGGQYRKIPFCNWELQCKVEIFRQWYQKNKIEDFLTTCGVVDEEDQLFLAISVIQFAIILVLSIWIVKNFCLKKNRENINIKSETAEIQETMISQEIK